MRLAIIGSRTIVDSREIKSLIDSMIPYVIEKETPLTIISGGAKGVDTVVQEWASERQHDFILIKPYHLLDSRVPYEAKYFFVRNKQIVDNSDVIIAIWDEVSNGTHDTIRYAKKCNKQVIIYSTKQSKCISIP